MSVPLKPQGISVNPNALWNEIKAFVLHDEPAVAAWAMNGGLALLAANVFGVNSTQEAAITVAATGFFGLIATLRTTPFAISGVIGALATMSTAGAAFGLHWPATTTGSVIAGLSAVLGLLLRANVSPSKPSNLNL